jgi:menaquinone-dependent protoporphyrinogen oxidase
MVPKALLLYATTHGHAAKIASRLGEALRADGVDADLREVKTAGDPSPRDYDGVIAGASLHAGHHQRPMVDWVKAHRTELAERPTAFFSVSLTAAEDSDEARTATRKCIEDFLDETGWTPDVTQAIAGALQYREYDVFTRLLMRLKMRHGGQETDTAQDHEYTDWAAVKRFATSFASRLGARR